MLIEKNFVTPPIDTFTHADIFSNMSEKKTSLSPHFLSRLSHPSTRLGTTRSSRVSPVTGDVCEVRRCARMASRS